MPYSQLTRRAKTLIISNFLLLLLSVSACSESSNEIPSTEKLREEFGKAIEDFIERPEQPIEELKKLHQLEYNVFSLPANSSTSKIEGALDEFGKKRWDCFQALQIPAQEREMKNQKVNSLKRKNSTGSDRLLFMCKRRPETFLKYIPRSVLGR